MNGGEIGRKCVEMCHLRCFIAWYLSLLYDIYLLLKLNQELLEVCVCVCVCVEGGWEV